MKKKIYIYTIKFILQKHNEVGKKKAEYNLF